MQTGKRYLLLFLAGILLLCLGWFMRTIVIYVLIATVLSLMGRPLTTFLHKRHIGKKPMPRAVSAFITLLCIYLILSCLIALFIPLVIEESRIISNTKGSELIAALHEPISSLDHFISKYWPEPFSSEQYIQEKLPGLLNAGQVNALANSLIGFTGGVFVAFFAISFLTFFFLKDGRMIFETLMLFSPPAHEVHIRDVVHDCKRLLGKYFRGLGLDSLCVSMILTFALYIAGIPNALLIGVFAGLVNVIPYVGPLIAMSFGLFVALSTGLGPESHALLVPTILKVVLIFLGTNLLDGMVLQPWIFSNTVRAHPLEIFLVILCTGTIAGIGAMILAVPSYTVVRVIAKQFLSKYKIVRKMTAELND
jgi:predicted PurR-regulated permease PerM